VPPLPPVFGTAKIIVKQTLAGVNVFNVLHASSVPATGWAVSELQAMANAVRAAWVTNVLPLQASTLTLTDVQVVDLSSNTGNEATASGSSNGTAVASSLPANVAVTWSWRIGTRYRGGHPRTYIGGIPTNAATNANTILASSVTAHLNAATAIRAAINGVNVGGNPAAHSVVHYVRGGVRLGVPETSFTTGVSVDSRFDSQRRRLGRDR
jgi:hypothetical protein